MLHLLIRPLRDLKSGNVAQLGDQVRELTDLAQTTQSIIGTEVKRVEDRLTRVYDRTVGLLSDTEQDILSRCTSLSDMSNVVNKLKNLQGYIKREISELTSTIERYRAENDSERTRFTTALSGDLVLVSSDVEISAADLNAAAADSLTRQVLVSLKSSGGRLHNWASFAPVVSSGETVVDADVAAPTVEWTVLPAEPPKFVRGTVDLTVTFDTDEGATKTYVAGEELTVTVKVASDDKLLGWTVAPVTVTFTVV